MSLLFAAMAACRFLAFSAALSIFGAHAMLAIAGARGAGRAVAARLRRPMRWAAWGGVLAVVALLPLQAAGIEESWRAALDVDTLCAVAFQTAYGKAWCLRLAAALLLVTVIRHAGGRRPVLCAALAAIALLPIALGGHAAMRGDWLGALHRANDALHLLAAGFWLGALPVFLGFLAVARGGDAHRTDAGRALLRFSLAGHVAVAALLVSGTINAVLILPPTGMDLDAPYQRVLLVKVLVALAMVALALVNRYRWVRRLRAEGDAALDHIRRNAIAAWAGGVLVLALTAMLGLMSP